MTLEQCKKILKIDFESNGEYNRDVGIYKEGKEYCILYHYEAETINTDAKYICSR